MEQSDCAICKSLAAIEPEIKYAALLECVQKPVATVVYLHESTMLKVNGMFKPVAYPPACGSLYHTSFLDPCELASQVNEF